MHKRETGYKNNFAMKITITDNAAAQTITSLMLLSAEYIIVLNELSQC